MSLSGQKWRATQAVAGLEPKKPRLSDIAELLSEDLFYDRQFADPKVICAGRSWFCHRAVLCPRSDFFMEACKIPGVEGTTGVIEIKIDNEFIDVLGYMVCSLYMLDCPDFSRMSIFEIYSFGLRARKCRMPSLKSDRYRLLRGRAKTELSRWSTLTKETRASWIKVLDGFGGEEWSEPRAGLSYSILQALAKNPREPMKDKSFCTMLKRNNRFMFELLDTVTRECKEAQEALAKVTLKSGAASWDNPAARTG